MNVKNQHGVPESDSVFELWPLNVSTLQYLSMYFTFFKFLYRLNYMAYKAELDIMWCTI